MNEHALHALRRTIERLENDAQNAEENANGARLRANGFAEEAVEKRTAAEGLRALLPDALPTDETRRSLSGERM